MPAGGVAQLGAEGPGTCSPSRMLRSAWEALVEAWDACNAEGACRVGCAFTACVASSALLLCAWPLIPGLCSTASWRTSSVMRGEGGGQQHWRASIPRCLAQRCCWRQQSFRVHCSSSSWWATAALVWGRSASPYPPCTRQRCGADAADAGGARGAAGDAAARL